MPTPMTHHRPAPYEAPELILDGGRVAVFAPYDAKRRVTLPQMPDGVICCVGDVPPAFICDGVR